MIKRLHLCPIPKNQSNKSSIFHGSNQSISCIHWNFTFKRLVKFMELEYAHYIKWLQRRPILAHNAHSGPWWNVFAMCHTILVARCFQRNHNGHENHLHCQFWNFFIFLGPFTPLIKPQIAQSSPKTYLNGEKTSLTCRQIPLTSPQLSLTKTPTHCNSLTPQLSQTAIPTQNNTHTKQLPRKATPTRRNSHTTQLPPNTTPKQCNS